MSANNTLRHGSRAFKSTSTLRSSPRFNAYRSRSILSSASCIRQQQRQPFYPYQIRSISFFGFGSSNKESAFEAAHKPTDLSIKSPSDVPVLEGRGLNVQGHNPNPSFEPQVIEDIQQSIAKPHVADPPPLIQNLEDIPERMGYLKEVCGLDFGWGPTAILQNYLEALHIWGGLSWVAAIPLIGITIRLVMVPYMIKASRTSAKLREIQPILTPLKEQIQAANKAGDKARMIATQQQMRAVYKEGNVKIYDAFLPILIQIPFGFGAWRLLRNCAELPVPAFVTSNWLWTSDLTFGDPYFILPAMSAALVYATFRTNIKTNANQENKNFMVIMGTVAPILSGVFTAFQPGSVQLYFVSSTFLGLLTAQMLANPAFRRFMNMPTISPPTSAATIGTETASSKMSQSFRPGSGEMHMKSRTIDAQARDITNQSAPSPPPSSTSTSQENISIIDKGLRSASSATSSVRAAMKGVGEQMNNAMGMTKEEKIQQKRRSDITSSEAQRRKLDEEKRAVWNARSTEAEEEGPVVRGGMRMKGQRKP